jgi:hypothetical protein
MANETVDSVATRTVTGNRTIPDMIHDDVSQLNSDEGFQEGENSQTVNELSDPLIAPIGAEMLSTCPDAEDVEDVVKEVETSPTAVESISGEPELTYIDEYGISPEDQYNTATSVSFFNPCSATLGYPTARLLQYRLSGIVSTHQD